MLYTVFMVLFLLMLLLTASHLLGKLGSSDGAAIDESAACAFAILLIYGFIFLSYTSFRDILPAFETICNGIPFVSNIADYGSLSKVLHSDPLGAATAFLDTVILSTLISLTRLVRWNSPSIAGQLMVRLLTAIVQAFLALLMLNFVRSFEVYGWVVSFIGLLISCLSVTSIAGLTVALQGNQAAAAGGLLGISVLFSRSVLGSILRSAFFQAIAYVLGIWLLERYFGSLAGAASVMAAVVIALGPILILVLAMIYVIRLVRK